MTLKLGPTLAHHFAHSEGQECVVRRPETALHFNAKFHIAKQLEELMREGKSLRLSAQCVAGLRPSRRHDVMPQDVPWFEWEMERCAARDERDWPIAWDDVKVEHRLMSEESRRVPDVLLLHRGKAVAAIEVYATHLVDEEKARVLADLRLPWIEVVASEILPTGGEARDEAPSAGPWLPPAGLPILRQSAVRPWRCPVHQSSYDSWREEQRKAREEQARRDAEEAERGRHTVRLKALRIVDVMYPTGKHYRNLYRLEENLTDGKPHSIGLSLNDRTVFSVRLGGSTKRALWSRIQDACERDIARFRERASAIDSPMQPGAEWIRGPLLEKVWQRVTAKLKWRFGYPLADHYPMRYRLNRVTGEWFIPPDLAHVTWDRPNDDPLDRHPASSRSVPDRRQRTSEPAEPMAPRDVIATFGGRLREADLELPVEEVIENVAFKVFILRPIGDADAARVALGVPLGKALCERLQEADRTLCENGILRLWASPPGDWTRACLGLPWCPVTRDSSRRLALPDRIGFSHLADLICALSSGEIALDKVIAWKEAARLQF